jgi:hypothetical protein
MTFQALAAPRSIMTLSLKSRPTVRQGDALPLQLQGEPSPDMESWGYIILFDVSDLRIDNRAVLSRPTAEQMADFQGHQGMAYVSSEHGCSPSDFPVLVDGTMTRQMSIGVHHIDATLRLYRYKYNDFEWDADGQLQPASSLSKATTRALPRLLATEDMIVSTTFVVFDNAHEPPVMMTDAKLREAVRSSIKIEDFSVDPSKRVQFDVYFKNPPVPLKFIVVVEPSEGMTKSFAVRGATCEAKSTAGMSAGGGLLTGDIATVKVIFRPDIAAARQSIEAAPIWGEDVVFQNVPVTLKP